MDEGLPIAYRVLERGVPVLSGDGEEVGTVDHVVAAVEQDIFHGLVIDAKRLGRRFVPAEDVASLHERGVDLRIPAAEVAALPGAGRGRTGIHGGSLRVEVGALDAETDRQERLAPARIAAGRRRAPAAAGARIGL